MTLKNIVWLASYPKSGNTWTRIFLSNYLISPDKPLPINQVHRLGMGDSVPKAYEKVCDGPFDPKDYHHTVKLRNKVLRGIVNNRADMNFIKTHNLKGHAFGQLLIPAEFSRAAVYILRDPRDMVLSYARHYGHTIDGAISTVGRSDNTTAAGEQAVKHFLGSWTEHVRSWTSATDFPVLAQRYEDMLADPHATFRRMLEFLGIPIEQDRLDTAIKHSSFGELQKQESAEPFVERSTNEHIFFHTGTSGHWKTQLTADQAEKIKEAQGAFMQKFGYL